MTKWLIYIFIFSIFVFEFLFHRYGIGIRPLTWIPEIVSVIVVCMIPFKTAVDKSVNIPIKYSLLIVLYLSHLLLGFIFNEIPPGAILAGLRTYTKFIPIFLMPIVFSLTEESFKKIVKFIYFLAMIQFPVVLYQRFVEYKLDLSGDKMGGTLGAQASGVLSIFMLMVLSFLIAFYFKDLISFRLFIFSFAASFLPTTMNETKITFILLPISLIFPAIFLRDKIQSIIRISLAAILLTTSFFVLKEVYNYFQIPRWGYGIETFVAMPGRLEGYSERRIDPIIYAIDNAKKDIRFSLFGHGAGNVSEGFTPFLNGKYVQEGIYYDSKSTSFTTMIWEIGFLGILIFLLFPLFVFLDFANFSKDKSFFGAFSLGMLSFTVLFVLSFFYTDTMIKNLFMYLFFFSAGYVAYRRNQENYSDTKTRLIDRI